MQRQLIAGRYQVLRAIGRGGMGTVWLCRDEVLGREVAVKQIGALPGESATETKRAMREARSAASVNHPNAVAVYDVVDHDGGPWLVMEYVEGETLADEISRDGRLSPQRVAEIGAQLAGALARAHERRIVHRDIKPGNVLIDKAGRPKISDFGIARGHGDEQLTQVGFITGTPGYLSPELARGGDPHSASDVWALGATLYAAVEGQTPYEPRSNPIALLRAIATQRPRPMTHAGALTPAIDAMMHEDPACRWDMATSARRLGGIARAGGPAVRRVDRSATRVLAVTPPEPTQTLAPTQRVEVIVPVAPAAAGTSAAAALVVAKRVVKAPVGEAAVVKPPVVVSPVGAKPRVAEARVVKPPVVVSPVVERPVIAELAVAEVPGEGASGRRLKPILLCALLVGVLGAAYLLSPIGDPSGTIAHPPATRVSGPAKPTATGMPNAAETRSASTPAPGSTGVAPALNADKQLADFVSSYYANVTGNRDITWAQLSPGMQAFARGRSDYEGFWKSIRTVRVNQVQANAAAMTAVVSLTYTKSHGGTSNETHNFTFVRNGTGYLIQSDR